MKGGEGQGKTSSLPNWLFQSSTLLKSLEDQCKGLYITSVDGKYVSNRVAEGYVDDCDAVTVDQQTQDQDTLESIQEKMRDVAQTWADLIYGSRGSKARLATLAEIKAEVKVTHSKANEAAVLNWIEPTDAIRQLGLKNGMLGGHKVDFTERYKSSIRMASQIKKIFISPKNA
eukprot:7359223-Ditylum_brightwellii.AAC.1